MKASPLRIRIVGSFAATALLLVLVMPRTTRFRYDYTKGQEWKYETLISQFDFPILKSEEQIQKEKESLNPEVIPYYKYSEEAVESSLRSLDAIDFEGRDALKHRLVRSLKNLYQHGVVADGEKRQLKSSSPSEVVYVQKDRRAEKVPASEILELSEARNVLRRTVAADFISDQDDEFLSEAGAYDALTANLEYDKINTQLVRAGSDRTVSPTMGYVGAGQLIVSNGEIVTAEIAQILDSYRKEYDANIGYDGPRVLYWTGNSLVAIAILVLLYLVILLVDSSILRDSRMYCILLLFFIASAAALLVERLGDNFLYLVPFTVFALYLQAFFSIKVLVPVYAVMLLPLMIFTRSGIPLFVMFLVAGLVCAYSFQFLGKGWKQFVSALIVFGVLMAVYSGFRLLGVVGGDLLRVVVFVFIGSMLTVAAYPVVFLLEKVCNLVSSMRLEELSNTNGALIRKLELLAPGTFQHSLQVMHMSAAAARAVGGNVPLIRAAALYHDIGKLANPQCFVENESLITIDSSSKYHQNLDPLQSARDIIDHVGDGVELAERNNIPSVVSDFILAHHGTTLVSYFYDKFVKQGGDPAMINEFRYKGHKPHSKEQIILMICDSIEAASRTLPSYDPETFDTFVEKIVASKMDQEQFDSADITIRELGIVKSVIKSHLSQIYHERIVYPEKKSK